MISLVTKCFFAACLELQCRLSQSTARKTRTTITAGWSRFDPSSLLKYTNGRVSTTRNKLSLGNYLHIDLEETIEYALTPTTTLRRYTLIRLTRPIG